MRLFKSLALLLRSLISIVLGICWNALIWLVDHIDGGEADDPYAEDSTIDYNFRTGDIDPVKRIDGLYSDHI